MRWHALGLALSTLVLPSVASAAAITINPLVTFGGDGWLAPGEGGYAYLGTGGLERGIAFGNGHVYLTSRANVSGSAINIRVLNATTGADLGGLSNSGITGGTNTINNMFVGGDGAIYTSNLTIQSTTTPFKVYRWATEASTPTVAYTGDAALAGSRVGDDLAGFGSGASTLIVAGYGSSPAPTGINSYVVIDPTAGTASRITMPTPPNGGDFRLGITMIDSTHVLGAQGSSIYRNTSYSGTTGTLINSPTIPDPAGAGNDRLLAYAVVGGLPLLAVQSITDSHVSIYDVTNPGAPVYLVSGNTTPGVGLTANTNGTGELAWNVNGNTATLYAMSTNQGIQAFIVTVPEPASLSMLGLMMLGARRKRT